MIALALPSFAALLPRIALGCALSMLALPALAGETVKPRTDLFGDPLPPGAIARLGTVRCRHVGSLSDILFTPDGKTIISAGDHDVRIWEIATGKLLRRFGVGSGALSMRLSVDGRRVALWRYKDGGGPVEIWDMASGKLLHKFGKQYLRSVVCLTSDGQRSAILENSYDAEKPCRIEIWDAVTGQRLREWNGPKERISGMCFSADGKKLFLGGGKKSISIYDVAGGKEIRRQRVLRGKVYELILSPRGDRIAVIEEADEVPLPGRRVFLVDTRTGAEVRRWSVKKENRWIWKLAFAPDGKKMAACTYNGPIRIWYVADGKEVQYLSADGHYMGALLFAPDGQTLAVNDGCTIRLLNAQSGADRLPTECPRDAAVRVAVAADGHTAFTATDGGMIYRWDARTGRMLGRRNGHTQHITDLALSADARLLYWVSEDQTVRVWSQSTGEQRRLLDVAFNAWSRLALSSDGALLAVSHGEHNKQLLLVQAANGKRLHKLATKGAILALTFTPDGTSVRALTANDKDLLMQSWETATGRLLPDMRLPSDPKATNSLPDVDTNVVFSPDGKSVAHSFADKVLRVIDADSRRVVHRLTTLPGWASALAFAPDGRTLAWAERSGTIHWLEAATWSERRRMSGHTGTAAALAFSEDGRLLVSGSSDTTALVWNLWDSGPALLPVEQREACWNDLADKDAARAYRAMCRLIGVPAEAVALLRRQLKPFKSVDEKRIEQRVADLDSDQFAVREKATEELRKLGELAEPKLRQALTLRPSLEKKRRVQGLLDDIRQRPWQPSPEDLRQLRAVEVLERLGTPEARKLLDMLANGAAGARLTCEARAAVHRLRLRTAP